MDSQKSPTVIQIEKVSETLKETPADNQDQSFVIQEIQKAAEERAKKRPVIQKILNRINGKPSDFTEIVINSEPLEKRVAMLHNGILEKFEVERTGGHCFGNDPCGLVFAQGKSDPADGLFAEAQVADGIEVLPSRA